MVLLGLDILAMGGTPDQAIEVAHRYGEGDATLGNQGAWLCPDCPGPSQVLLLDCTKSKDLQ